MQNCHPFLRSSRVAAMDSPTSPGSSGLGARMPHYRDEDMGAIHKAASMGNLWRVMQILLFRKSSLNDRDKMSRTALHVACGKGHPRVVRLLARRHCLLNLCDIDNKTALIHAIQNEQEECAVILLDHGADPNVTDIQGNTPLHYAVLGQNTAIVEKLLSCMANMEATNKDGFTPLSHAKYVNNEKMVEFLVTRGSKVHQKEGGGPQATEKETCLKTNTRVYTTKKSVFKRLANKSSNQQATSEKKEKGRLLKYSGINNLVTDLQKSLKQAWSKRKSKKVRELTEEEALFRHTLKVACYRGHKRVVSQLARRRRLLDLCDTDNKTALIHAIEYEQEECAAILLEHGADPNVMDIHGNTALHYAVLSQNTTIAEKLVSCMANLEVRNKDDFTPLSLAKSENKEKMVEFLLTKGSKDHPMEGNQQSTSEKTEERRPMKSSDSDNLGMIHIDTKVPQEAYNQSNNVREISEEESLYSKHRIAVSCPTSDNVVFKVEEEEEEKSSKMEVSKSVYDGADDDSDDEGLSQHSNREQTDNQQPKDNINENAAFLVDKVEEQEKKTSSKREVSGNMQDGAEDNSDSVGVRQEGNMEQSEKQQVPIKEKENSHGTALHMACGKGHRRVVRRLARRHCPMDLCDIDTKTALIYAIQNEQEEFAVTLLDHGADPNLMDIHGNTPLHYAVLGQNTAIVEKLLSCMANMEVRNEDKFTPLSLAKYVNNEKMVEFLVTRSSKVHQTEGGGPQATEKETCLKTNTRVYTTKKSVFKRLAIKSSNQQATSEKKEKRRLLKYSGINNLVTDLQKSLKQAWSKRKSKKVLEISEEESLYSIAVSCPTSDNVVFKVEEEEEEKSSKMEVSKSMYDGADDDSDDEGLSQHSNREQTDNQQPKDNINENAVILMNTVEEQVKKTSSKREVSGNVHDGAEDNSDSVGVRPKGNMEQSEKQQVPIKDNVNTDRNGFPHWCCGFYSKHRIAVACPTSDNVVFKVEEKNKKTKSKMEVSENMYDGANDDNDRSGLRQQINSEQTDSQQPNDKINENAAFLVDKVKEKKKPKSSKREESENMYDGAGGDSDNDGLSQHSNWEQIDNQQPNDTINETAVILMNKVEEQEKKTSSKREVSGNMHDGAEDNSDSVGVRKKGNMEQSEKQQVPIKEKENSHGNGFPHWCCGFYSKRRIAVACPTSDNVVFKVEEKNKKTKSKMEVSENIYDGANDDNDRSGLRQQINSEQTDSQQPNDKINENAAFLVDKVKEKKKPKSSKREESENMYDGAGDDSDNDGLSQHSNREQIDNQQPNDTINENAVILMNKVEEQEKKTSSKREVSGNMHDGAEDNSDSVGVRKKGNMEQSEKQQVPIKDNVNTDRNGFPHWSCGLYSKRRIAVACTTSDNVVFKVEGEKKQRSSIKEVSGNISDGADDDSDRNGWRHPGNSQHTDTQQSNDKINENTVYLMNKVEEKKEQKNSKREESGNMYDGANDDTDSAGGRQKSNSEQSDKHRFPIVENDDSERLTSQDEEKRQKADLLNKKNTGQTRKQEKQSIKKVEMNPKVENTTRTQVMALKTVRRNKVSDSDEKERLLRENRMLKNKIAKLTLELDTVKNQNPEMEEKNDLVDIVIVKEKIDHLQKTITETLFQPNAQLEVLRAELTMLSSKLEDEQQNRRRLEAEGDSHRSRRATVVQDHEHCQTLKGDLQVDVKKEKEEWICSQDKNKSDMSNLKCDIIEIFSQKFSILENKVNSLEIELHHTRDALRERAVVLEDGEGDQSQTQCQKKELENAAQRDQGKVNADIGKQESLHERLSHLQSENKLLQQQLERAHYKSEKKGKTVIRIQDQIVDTIKILPANSEKQGLMLNETCKELIHECHLLKESRLVYENDKAQRDAVVRQLQGELADTQRKLRQLQGELADTQRKLRQLQGELVDTQRKLSMTEASLKVEPHHCMCSQYKIQELQKELDESRSQCERQKEESKKYIDLNISLKQSLHEEMKKKSDLEKPMARFQEPLNKPERNLNEELSFPRDLKPTLIEMGMQTDRILQEAEELIAASKCNYSPEDNTDQLEEEMKELQKKCDKMTTRAEWWKQELIRVRRQMEINRAKHLEEEQRLDRIGECARPDIAYRREQIRQFYQDFFAL